MVFDERRNILESALALDISRKHEPLRTIFRMDK